MVKHAIFLLNNRYLISYFTLIELDKLLFSSCHNLFLALDYNRNETSRYIMEAAIFPIIH